MQGLDIFLGNDINETRDSVEWVAPIYDLVVNQRCVNDGTFKPEHLQRLRNNAKNILSKANYNSGLWGFKLPESILCLAELKKAFPKAKIIHLVRHPVSISLRRTHMTSRVDNPVGKRVLRDAYSHIGRDQSQISSDNEALNNAISWNYQLNQASNFFDSLVDQDSLLTVKYEAIIDAPQLVLSHISKLLNVTTELSDELEIDYTRSNQNLDSSPVLDQVWDITKVEALKYGYTKHNNGSK